MVNLNRHVTRIEFFLCCFFLFLVSSGALAQKKSSETTFVKVEIPTESIRIDPMIYGQMLEDCNDKIIYGGLINKDGSENQKVYELLKPLQMPVVRWPGGTYVHEYDWKKGIGPMDKRPVVDEYAWKGKETNQFGTDEFLQWCKRIGTEPYINLNMGNDPNYGASLGDALSWIEYVNGSTVTTFGKKRAFNGHPEPYGVKYWGIGNENYGPWGRHAKETAIVYADRLHRWAGAIRFLYPDLKLLGVGHTYHWNDTVLQKNGELVDLLTLHFYMTSNMKDGKLQNPESTLFSPIKIERQIQKNAELLTQTNLRLNRQANPLRYCVDEWNCRHSVFEGEKYVFTRNAPRRQYDVVTIAGMLNVFIRQSASIGMANYIFPVNGHGLIRTVGQSDAYKTPTYYVFELYRKYMLGKKLNVDINGKRVILPMEQLSVHGDVDTELNSGDVSVSVVDAVAVMNDEENLYVTVINRSHNETQKIRVVVPDEYVPVKIWRIESSDINGFNTENSRGNIASREMEILKKDQKQPLSLSPCGFILIQCVKKQ